MRLLVVMVGLSVWGLSCAAVVQHARAACLTATHRHTTNRCVLATMGR